jgi:hypothetical protein
MNRQLLHNGTWLLTCFAMAFLNLVPAFADESDVKYGPPASPLSWTAVRGASPGDWSGFSTRRDYLGVPRKPTTLTLVELRDERPYGACAQSRAWLARFDSVLVTAEGKGSKRIAVSLAFDTFHHDLLCAFTDASPVWAQGAKRSELEARWRQSGRNTSPAQYKSLKSSVVAVLEEGWRNWGIDPGQRGQVILRPRFAEFTQSPQPVSNVWIVEALGTYVMTRYGPPSLRQDSTSAKAHGWDLTTIVNAYRDEDLKFVGGLISF